MDVRTIRRTTAARLGAMVAISAAFIVIGGAGAAVTAPAAQSAGPPDSLMGSGQRLNLAGQPIKVNVSALSGPNGEDAHGTFQTFTETAVGTVTIRGKIHCLTVEGDRAAALGTIEQSTSAPNPVGDAFQIQVTDNQASGTPDTNINFFGFEPGTTDCPIIPFDEVPITKGNFAVHDAG
jgi:hypothetical protein